MGRKQRIQRGCVHHHHHHHRNPTNLQVFLDPIHSITSSAMYIKSRYTHTHTHTPIVSATTEDHTYNTMNDHHTIDSSIHFDEPMIYPPRDNSVHVLVYTSTSYTTYIYIHKTL